MMVPLIIELLLLVLLLMLSGFFSSSETIMICLNPLDVRRMGQTRPEAGRRVQALIQYPHRLLSSILIGNTFVNVAAASLGYTIAEQLAPAYGEAIAIPVMTLLLLFFGEIGPKQIGLQHASALAPFYAGPLEWCMRVTRPIRSLMEYLTHKLEPFFTPHGRTLSDEEYETVVDISGEHGVLQENEWAMVKSIIHLEDMKAADVMTPRVDIEFLDLTDRRPELEQRVLDSRFSYLPLVRGGVDQVEGLLDVQRFLLEGGQDLEAARLEPLYVPETAPLNAVLNQMQQHRCHIAVVVDEYGGVAGVITQGDILEEITGDIYDELNKPKPIFQTAGPHSWIVDPDFNLDELNRKLRLSLRAEGVDRLAGWITAQLGHIPQAQDVATAQGCRVTVLQTRKNRVTLAQIEKLEAAP